MSVLMTAPQVTNRYFLEMRCKVLEVAASLDRIDRAGATAGSDSDPRLAQLRRAIRVLLEDDAGRAEKVQMIFSRGYDPHWTKK